MDSTIGVRQGSCEDPVLFLFIMQAAMETLQWPDGVARPEFKTHKSGVTMGENSNRKWDATPFELWASLFADDCALLFNSRDDLITGSNHILLTFASLVSKCTLVAAPRHPKPRRCTFHLHVKRTRLRTRRAF